MRRTNSDRSRKTIQGRAKKPERNGVWVSRGGTFCVCCFFPGLALPIAVTISKGLKVYNEQDTIFSCKDAVAYKLSGTVCLNRLMITSTHFSYTSTELDAMSEAKN